MTKIVVIFACISLLATIPCSADIIYVKEGASGNGTSWASAFGLLQSALGVAGNGAQIWVAEGTYYPTYDYGLAIGDRGKHFRMKHGVEIYGGFPSYGDPDMSDRDPNQYETILSGDIGVVDDDSDNCYHVFYHPYGTYLDATAVLDGFTITGGNANGLGDHDDGGGMYNIVSSPTLINCTFSSNVVSYHGGGISNQSSIPTVAGCTFSLNRAMFGGGMSNEYDSYATVNTTVTNCKFNGNMADVGAGIYNFYSDPNVTNCIFSGNSANGTYGRGGGMCNSIGHPTVTRCTFGGNLAYTGGAMYNLGGKPTVTYCKFNGNMADVGAGIYNLHSDPNVTNCIFSGNSAESGGGMYNGDYYGSLLMVTNCTFSDNEAVDGGGMYNHDSTPTVVNCIFWANTAPQIYNTGSSSPTVTYSDVQGGYPGEGNIDADPLFADPDGPDNVTGTQDDNLRLLAGSPCIDAGDSNSVGHDLADLDGDGDTTEPIQWDMDGHNRFVDDPCTPDTGIGTPPIVDMGAYERGICGDADHPYITVGDINNDCEVDITDAVILALAWLSEDGQPRWNPACNLYEADSIINASDFSILGAHWLECTKPECD